MSGRNIWLRILAGTCRDGVYYWFSTLDPGSADPPAWVAASTPSGGTSQWLPIQTVPQIQSGSVDPLEPLASGGRISVVVQSSEAVRAIVAQTLGTSVEARRVGGLTAYAGPGATTFQVSEGATLVDSGYYVIGTEIVQVTDASGLASDPPTVVVARGQLGTWTRGHASVLAGVGTPIVPLDSAQIVGQWAELGVTDGGVDRVVWRGRVRSASASSDQTVSIHLDSLLSVVRDHRPLVPVLLPESIPSEGEPDGDTLRTEVRLTADPGDLPVADWRYARFVGESGDWALLTSNDPGDWAAAVTQDGDVVTMQPRIATTNQVSVTVSESRQAADDLETAARSTLDAAREDDGSARLGADRTFDDQRWFTVSSNVESGDGTTERLAYGTVTGGYRLVVELETVDADDSTALDARSTFRELMESVRLTS